MTICRVFSMCLILCVTPRLRMLTVVCRSIWRNRFEVFRISRAVLFVDRWFLVYPDSARPHRWVWRWEGGVRGRSRKGDEFRGKAMENIFNSCVSVRSRLQNPCLIRRVAGVEKQRKKRIRISWLVIHDNSWRVSLSPEKEQNGEQR